MPTSSRWSASALTFLLAALAASALPGASDAQAAGMFLPGHGVRPLGRGGAFVASGAGDLNSLWHNPANLATLEELTLTVDLSLINLDMTFQRAPRTTENGERIDYARVANEAPPKPNPQILLGGSISEKLKWGFGLYAPYLSGETYPEEGAQRYVLVDNDTSILLYTHFALAYQINKNVRVGLGFQNVWVNFVLVNVTSGYVGLFGEPEDRDLDILTRATLRSLFTPSGNGGIWVKLAESVEAGLSFQLPVLIRDRDAKIEVRLPQHPAFDNATLSNDTLDVGLKLPLVVRLGLRFQKGRFDYELAAVYEGWSIFDKIQANPNDIVVENVPGVGSVRVAPLAIPMNWQDTFSVRNGFEYRATDTLNLRAGYTFETKAIPDAYYSVFLADGTKHIGTLGATYRGKSWSLDAALAYYYMPDRDISDSQVRQINPTDAENELTLVVGNGQYTQRYMILGLGFNKKF